MKAEAGPKVRIDRTGGVVAVSFLVTTLDKRNFVQVSDELDEVLRDPNPRTVEIDLSTIRRIDDLGMAFLQSLIESIKDVGGKATLRGTANRIKQAVCGTRLASALNDRRIPPRPPLGTRW